MNALQCVSYRADVPINKLSIRSNPFFVRLCCSIVKNHEKCHQLQYHHRVDYYLPMLWCKQQSISHRFDCKWQNGDSMIQCSIIGMRSTAAFLDKQQQIVIIESFLDCIQVVGCISQTTISASRFRNEQNHSLLCIYTYVNI